MDVDENSMSWDMEYVDGDSDFEVIEVDDDPDYDDDIEFLGEFQSPQDGSAKYPIILSD